MLVRRTHASLLINREKLMFTRLKATHLSPMILSEMHEDTGCCLDMILPMSSEGSELMLVPVRHRPQSVTLGW